MLSGSSRPRKSSPWLAFRNTRAACYNIQMEQKVCQKFCKSYKPGVKDRKKCGSYEFLRANLTKMELRQAAEAAPAKPDFSSDDTISEMVCSECGFLDADCKYRQGTDSAPCGGYSIISHMLRHTKGKA